MSGLAAPNVLNYTVGKGLVEVLRSGDSEWVRLGNCPEFEFTPEVEKLEHFSSMEGTKTKDRTVILEKKGTLRVVMEEWTVFNLRLALLGGTVDTQSGGDEEFEIFSESSIVCQVRFIGTNDVGTKFVWHFLRVDFIPSGAINPISDEWAQMEITGEVSTSGGSFGTVTKIADGA
jgi:hypothetical protein